MRFFGWLKPREMAPINRVAVVTCDDQTITFRWAWGSTAAVDINEVRRVLIRTTDQGPFDDDVFFVVETAGKNFVIPQAAAGASQLLKRFQQLPGFDNEAVINSMGCTDNQEFACWEREWSRTGGRPMTEVEWLASNDPWKMLHVVGRSKPSERKVRLFNAAVCRRFWDYLPDESKALLSESELLAEGAIPVPYGDMDLCHRANAVVGRIDRQYPAKQFPTPEVCRQRDAAAAVCYAVIPNDIWGAIAYCREIDPTEKEPHAVIIRDVFGNPFRHIKISPSWVTPAVKGLAQAIYDERAFDRMPVLADALEAAGCHDTDILNHCRSEGQHVRGCWLVDQVLGMS